MLSGDRVHHRLDCDVNLINLELCNYALVSMNKLFSTMKAKANDYSFTLSLNAKARPLSAAFRNLFIHVLRLCLITSKLFDCSRHPIA